MGSPGGGGYPSQNSLGNSFVTEPSLSQLDLPLAHSASLPFPTKFHKVHGPIREAVPDDTNGQVPSASEIDLTAAIELAEKEAVASGGFASVYIGRYKGSQVSTITISHF
jgi:hypothetical protein